MRSPPRSRRPCAQRWTPLFRSLIAAGFVLFLLTGWVYGARVGTVRSGDDIARMAAESIAGMAPYVVLAFMAAHFIAMFTWSNLGAILAINGAEALRDAGLPVPWRVDTADEVAEIMRARAALHLPQGIVVAQPVAAADEMDRDLHDRTLAAGLAEVERRGVVGKDVTPFLLAWFHEHTGGASLRANVALVLANAALAAEIADELV